jgi:hypothetical protein
MTATEIEKLVECLRSFHFEEAGSQPEGLAP